MKFHLAILDHKDRPPKVFGLYDKKQWMITEVGNYILGDNRYVEKIEQYYEQHGKQNPEDFCKKFDINYADFMKNGPSETGVEMSFVFGHYLKSSEKAIRFALKDSDYRLYFKCLSNLKGEDALD